MIFIHMHWNPGLKRPKMTLAYDWSQKYTHVHSTSSVLLSTCTKVPMNMHTNFHVSLSDEPASFRFMAQFREKRNKWPQNGFNINVKHTQMYTIYILETQNDASMTLASFQVKSTHMHTCTSYTLEVQIFMFHSMISLWITVQFEEKCTRWPQKDLYIFKVKVSICMLHTPEAQIFICFALRWAVLAWGKSTFQIFNWVQCKNLLFSNIFIFLKFREFPFYGDQHQGSVSLPC